MEADLGSVGTSWNLSILVSIIQMCSMLLMKATYSGSTFPNIRANVSRPAALHRGGYLGIKHTCWDPSGHTMVRR